MSLEPRWIFCLLLLLCAQSAAGQGARSFADGETSAVPYSRTSARAQVPCTALTAWTGHDCSVTSATLIEASGGAPEYCRVLGVIPPEIRFSVDLPTDWNRRLYMHGNGGFAGMPPEAPARIAASRHALQRGFATTYTDTGHDATVEPLGGFALNNLQKEIDYSFRAVHLTIEIAKTIAARCYDAAPNFSYWDGCSTGGRQGLMSAQRFPDDFDGILAGAPVLNFSGTMVSYAWTQQALTKAPMSLAKVELLGRKVYERCDKLDGVADGLIEDPRQCDFDPAQHLPLCEGATGAECFRPPRSPRCLCSTLTCAAAARFCFPVGRAAPKRPLPALATPPAAGTVGSSTKMARPSSRFFPRLSSATWPSVPPSRTLIGASSTSTRIPNA